VKIPTNLEGISLNWGVVTSGRKSEFTMGENPCFKTNSLNLGRETKAW
jgi:hypothetical protein